MPHSSKSVLAYADGSCIGNPGPGGWGVVIVSPDGSEEELSGGALATTNNRMEMTAAIEALRRIDPGSRVVVRSDSEYLVKTMTLGWKRKANLDLWQRLEAEVEPRKVTFEWVRGHAGDPLNSRADELAHDEATKIVRGNRRATRPAKHDEPAARTQRLQRVEPTDEAKRAEAAASSELWPLLQEGETIRTCEGCGRVFVSERARHCTRVECQLQARRSAKAE